MQKRGQKARIIFDIFVLFFVLILLLLMNFYLFLMFLVVVDDDVFFYEIIFDKWILRPKHRKKSKKLKKHFFVRFDWISFVFIVEKPWLQKCWLISKQNKNKKKIEIIKIPFIIEEESNEAKTRKP